jgi:hypothetical protein
MVEVRAREAAMEVRTPVRFAVRVLDTLVLETVLDAAVLDLTDLCATVLDAMALWGTAFDAVAFDAAAFDAAAFDLPAFAAADLLGGVGCACEKAARCSGTLNIASARQAVIEVLRW